MQWHLVRQRAQRALDQGLHIERRIVERTAVQASHIQHGLDEVIQVRDGRLDKPQRLRDGLP